MSRDQTATADLSLAEAVRETFAEDFSQQPVRLTPQGWTPVWAGVQDWRVADHGPVEGYRTLRWDDVGEATDAEVLALVETTATSGTQKRLKLRITGEGGSENGYSLDQRVNGLRIDQWVDGSPNQLGAYELPDWEADAWYWMRFRAEGDRLMGKIWPDGSPEPSEWTIQRQDDTHSGPGGVGVGAYSNAGSATSTTSPRPPAGCRHPSRGRADLVRVRPHHSGSADDVRRGRSGRRRAATAPPA